MGGSWGKFAMERKIACELGNMCKSQVIQAELRGLGLVTSPFAGFQAQQGMLHTNLRAGEGTTQPALSHHL